MKRILDNCSPRQDHDGWVIVNATNGREYVLSWSFSTTREECRELRAGLPTRDVMGGTFAVRKAKVKIELV
jgi:hypothetical protein